VPIVLAAAVWSVARFRAGLPLVPGRAAEVAAPVPAAAKHAVAVLPFADETHQSSLAWAGPGIAEMLAANLAESPNLRVLDSLRVMRGVKDLRLAEGPVDGAAARQLAELWSVDTLVTGTLRQAGTRVRVDVSVEQVGPTGVTPGSAFHAEGNGEGDIFRLVAGLGEELRRRLGLSTAPGKAAPAAGTASVEAEKAYEEGRSASRGATRSRPPRPSSARSPPIPLRRRAEKLAETYQSLGYRRRPSARRSARSRPGEGRVARRLAAARARPAARRPRRRGEELPELRKFPNDTEPQLDLAVAQASRGQRGSRRTLKRVVAVDPTTRGHGSSSGRNTILMGDGSRDPRLPRAGALALRRSSAARREGGRARGDREGLPAVQRLPRALENSTAACRSRSRSATSGRREHAARTAPYSPGDGKAR
jgi:TolB-like protein